MDTPNFIRCRNFINNLRPFQLRCRHPSSCHPVIVVQKIFQHEPDDELTISSAMRGEKNSISLPEFGDHPVSPFLGTV